MFSFFLSVFSLLLLSSQSLIGLETLNAEEIENEIELSPDHFFEEEDLSGSPKQGHRPQVIQIPTKTALPQK